MDLAASAALAIASFRRRCSVIGLNGDDDFCVSLPSGRAESAALLAWLRRARESVSCGLANGSLAAPRPPPAPLASSTKAGSSDERASTEEWWSASKESSQMHMRASARRSAATAIATRVAASSSVASSAALPAAPSRPDPPE
eukprot:6210032-Pleurochrysis_carterae.AAC.2